jgi:hypothetical protein
MYRRTWVLEPDKLHDGAQPVAIEVAKAWLIGRPGIQCFKLQRRRRWLPGCSGRMDRYEPRGDRAGGEKTGHLRSLHHSDRARAAQSFDRAPTTGARPGGGIGSVPRR